jgi:stage IV sporulation protein FB
MKKNFLKIHPLTVFFFFIAFITGYFRYIIYLMSLIFIHEIGHVSAGILLGWKVEKIILLPFGGMSIFQEKINRPIWEEFVIAVMGPIYQILFYLLLVLLGYKTNLLESIHLSLLLFNLIPIYPLDGFKIFLLFLEKFFSFYKSQYISFFLSCFLILISFLFCKNFLLFLLLSFLIYQVILFYKQIPKTFFKFLLERYLYTFHFKKKKLVTNEKEMKRDYIHFFKEKDQLISEKEVLKKRFGKSLRY